MNRSESIGELAKALVKFNSKVAKIAKDAANPFFKNNYATLDNIIEEVRPILQENGLSLMQFPGGDGERVTLTTFLLHESGEWMESAPLIMKPVKNDPQAVGSCITYARRYSLQAFLNLNTGEDDDGNGATHTKPQQQQKPTQRGNTSNGPKKASDSQVKLVNTLITRMEKEKTISREVTLTTLHKKPDVGTFESTKDLTIGQASAAIVHLKKALGDE